MVTLRHLYLQRGGKPLFDDVSLTIHPGQKVGVVGANGAGKSTLLALLQGEIHQDQGDLERPPWLRIAHVAQETPALPTPAIEFVLDGDAELRAIQTALADAEARHDGVRLADLHGRFEAVDGYTAHARAAQLLAGLGFSPVQLEHPVADFSGGWRERLNLARALMSRSDLLLLDEPTNHLDLDAVLWLEQWLRSYAGTLLLISHDRDFLDTVVAHTAHVEQRQIRLYAGNYSAFEGQRAARLALQQAAYGKQRREIARLQSFINRFRAKATKARQAQSRLKALDRLERIAPAHLDSPFQFRFEAPEKLPNPLLTVAQAAAGYGDVLVLKGVDLVISPGDRLGLLGPNGAGKSTLIRMLAGLLSPPGGARREGEGLVVGYFAQHQLEQVRLDWSPLQHLQQLDPRATEQEMRDFLGGFGFAGDQALTPVAPFSGGEKARLVLALLVQRRPNLLLLDEPTNHLDLEMRHALTVALQEYEGALILVSHDRHLLRTTTDAFMLVDGHRVQSFAGDLDDYREWLGDRQRAAVRGTEQRPGRAVARREQKRLEAERRNELAARRRPLEQRIKAVEQRMEGLHADKAAVRAVLADPQLYEVSHKEQLKVAVLRQGQIERELAELEEEWLNLQDEMEVLMQT